MNTLLSHINSAFTRALPLALLVAGLVLAGVSITAVSAQSSYDHCDWDESFNGYVASDFSGEGVSALAEFHTDAREPHLYAGGNFDEIGGVPANGIARWDGEAWTPLGEGITPNWVTALAAFDDGTGPALYAGGGFSHAGGQPANNIARWDGEAWTPLGDGISGGWVRALAVFDDGSGPALYAAGGFEYAGGQPANGIARWDGEAWTPLGEGITGSWVSSLAVFDDGTGPALYAGGRFTGAGGQEVNGLARWDGEAWSDVEGLGDVVGADLHAVNSFITFEDGSGESLFAGVASISDTAGGLAQVARWNGIDWRVVGSVLGGVKYSIVALDALAMFDAGSGPSLFAGYNLQTVDAWAPYARVAVLNEGQWSPLPGLGGGPGTGSSVYSLIQHDDATGPALYVGGHNMIPGQSNVGIARWICDTVVSTEGDPDAGTLRLSTYPNPAASAATIQFEAPEAGPVHVAIHDILGRAVAVVQNGELPAGSHTFEWQTRGVAPGIYVVRVQTATATTSRRVVVAR